MDYTESLGITEISHRKNLHKSRVHRAVKTMEESGCLRQDPGTRRYSLSFRAFKLGIAAAPQFGTFPEIRMLLKRLAFETKGSVSIRIADHNEMVIVEAIDSTDILRVHSPVGGRQP
jgi:DNA-binding IclR family transcriptional regulator